MNYVSPIKSIVISGNLQSSIKYQLCPPSEFRQGVWNICLSSIGVSCVIPNVKELCSVSCNVVNAQKYNKTMKWKFLNNLLVCYLSNLEPKLKILIRLGST